jgi:hypothetical protein
LVTFLGPYETKKSEYAYHANLKEEEEKDELDGERRKRNERMMARWSTRDDNNVRENCGTQTKVIVQNINDVMNRDMKKDVSINIDGAGAYHLEFRLLRILIQPPDPNVWTLPSPPLLSSLSPLFLLLPLLLLSPSLPSQLIENSTNSRLSVSWWDAVLLCRLTEVPLLSSPEDNIEMMRMTRYQRIKHAHHRSSS